MSLPTAIAVIVVLDIALLGFLAWMMSHPRHLTPHVSAKTGPEPRPEPVRFTRDATFASEATQGPVRLGID